jgi:hypothetical protein
MFAMDSYYNLFCSKLVPKMKITWDMTDDDISLGLSIQTYYGHSDTAPYIVFRTGKCSVWSSAIFIDLDISSATGCYISFRATFVPGNKSIEFKKFRTKGEKIINESIIIVTM